jgi:lysyl-tRNA synthetase class 2
MQRIALHSIALQFAGYEQQKLLLEVGFCDGTVYQYSQVSRETFEELLRSESQGAYLNTSIRPHFAYIKIR